MIDRFTYWSERLFRLALSRSAPVSDRERRSRGIIRGTAAALVARGVGSLTGIITVPLTVRYLGAERYGAWMTIASALVVLNFSDLGLLSSLTNALGKAFGEDDRERARRYVTTTLAVFCIIAAILVSVGIIFARPIAILLFPSVSQKFLTAEIIPATMIAFSLFGLNFPLLISNRVLAAYQENATANLWVMASSVANLLGILVVIAFHGGLPLLVLGSGAAGLFVSAVGSIWLYCSHKPWLAPRRSVADFAFARELLSSSWKFFLASVAWLVNSQTDNLIIAHFLGPAAVTPYAVTFRLFAYATLIQTLAAQSVWPAYTEALARRDINWMRGIFQKNLKWGIMIAVGITALLTAFGQHIIRIWAGPIAVPPFSVIIWMAVWNVMLAYLFVMGTVLQATNHMTGIVIYSSVTAALNIVLSVWLVQLFGISGVIAATVIAYVVASLIPVTVETRTILRNLHRSHLPSPCR